MKPIEKMAEAAWHRAYGARWEELTEHTRNEKISDMRAALMALAEADLPRAVQGRELSIMDHAVFRAMLRTISVDEAS
jgi:hypothetical protein